MEAENFVSFQASKWKGNVITMKNRKGSTLVMTLIVFLILMIFASFILGFMVTENKQAIHHQNKTQAYYIARGGAETVEAALIRQLDSYGSNTTD